MFYVGPPNSLERDEHPFVVRRRHYVRRASGTMGDETVDVFGFLGSLTFTKPRLTGAPAVGASQGIEYLSRLVIIVLLPSLDVAVEDTLVDTTTQKQYRVTNVRSMRFTTQIDVTIIEEGEVA